MLQPTKPKGARRSTSDPPGFVALSSLLAANAVTFGCWSVANGGENGQMRKAMLRHFLCSRSHLQQGRLHTLLTSCIFHQRFAHCMFNTCALWTVGRIAAEHLTNLELAGLFAACGLGSSSGHVLLHRRPVLGASGMLMGIFTTSSMLQPERRLSVVAPFEGWMSIADLTHVFLGVNCMGFALRRWSLFQHVAWAAHIAGAAAGYGVGWLAYFAGDQRFADPLVIHKKTARMI